MWRCRTGGFCEKSWLTGGDQEGLERLRPKRERPLARKGLSFRALRSQKESKRVLKEFVSVRLQSNLRF